MKAVSDWSWQDPAAPRGGGSNVETSDLGPIINRLVTDIQVNVYIGNTLSRLSFQNWRMLKFK